MFTLSIVTPDKKLVTDQEIVEVFVPGFKGELNILPGHAPLVTTLTTGILRYRLAGETQIRAVAISWGYCEVSPDSVSILAETAETPEELDRDRIHIAMKESLTKITSDIDVELLEKFRRKYERSLVRNEVVTYSQGNQTTH